jgi:hypothetical protein
LFVEINELLILIKYETDKYDIHSNTIYTNSDLIDSSSMFKKYIIYQKILTKKAAIYLNSKNQLADQQIAEWFQEEIYLNLKLKRTSIFIS